MLHFAGENKKSIKHFEGDVWVESGKTWTIKNGVKRTINKMEDTRKYFLAPLVCPQCSKSMNHYLNQQSWDTHRVCFNCVIDLEHEIMKQGKWEEYLEKRKNANKKSFNKDLIDYLQDFIKEDVSRKHVTEDGVVEAWVGEDRKKVSSMVTEYIEKLKQNENDTDTH
jgi:Zn ribbon nucleic-acid-binding protein